MACGTDNLDAAVASARYSRFGRRASDRRLLWIVAGVVHSRRRRGTGPVAGGHARSVLRGLALTTATAVLLGGAAAAVPPAASVGTGLPAAAAVVYSAPLPTPIHVVNAFSPPRTRYGPGHVGIDLRARSNQPVRSAAAGKVSFAGPVAGRGIVVVTHADGIRTEYEPVRPVVGRGERVSAGQVIALIEGIHRGCPATCLHWGARRGDTYLDPLSLLGGLGPVRLLPWPASPP